MGDPVPVFLDIKTCKFMLQDGTPISNLHIMNVESRRDTFPIYELGSSYATHLPGPTRVSISAEFIPEDAEVIDVDEVNRKAQAIIDRFAV